MVPEKEQFESFFNLNKWEPSAELMAKVYEVELNHNDLHDLFSIELKEKSNFMAGVANHPVCSWLFGQPTTTLALKHSHGKRWKKSKSTRSSYVDGHVNYLMEKYAEVEEIGEFRRSVKSWVGMNPANYEERLLKIFHLYFYSERWKDVVRLGRDWVGVMNEAIKAYDTLVRLEPQFELLQEFYLGSGLMHFSVARYADRSKKFLEAIENDLLVLPVRRADETVRERVLVYDLYRFLTRNGSKNIPETISYFLMTEGVNNQLELRTIEKLLSNWKTGRNTALRVSRKGGY